jgi:hypothetical protein
MHEQKQLPRFVSQMGAYRTVRGDETKPGCCGRARPASASSDSRNHSHLLIGPIRDSVRRDSASLSLATLISDVVISDRCPSISNLLETKDQLAHPGISHPAVSKWLGERA